MSKAKNSKKEWWRSLTAEEQADYIYDIMLAKGKQADYQKIYADVVAKGEFLR